jgi:iron complex transport system permease protein
MRLSTFGRLGPGRKSRAFSAMIFLSIVIGITVLLSLNSGQVRLPPSSVWRTLWGEGTEREALILFDFRLPRIVISLLIGAGLAVSGCILQGLSRNALAEPGMLGLNAGAGLAVVLFISFVPVNTAAPVFALPFVAFAGAGLTAALVYRLAYYRAEEGSASRLLLVGVAVAAGISSCMLVLSIRLDPAQYQFVSLWLAGSIWGTGWMHVMALLPWILILLPVALFQTKVLDVLSLGSMAAVGLGANVTRQRLGLLAVSVGLAGSCVAIGGGIAFVGLIGPHLARRLVGPGHRQALPVSAMLGSLLLLLADTIARVLLNSAEIPTGIVVAVIGAPYFLYLLTKSRS